MSSFREAGWASVTRWKGVDLLTAVAVVGRAPVRAVFVMRWMATAEQGEPGRGGLDAQAGVNISVIDADFVDESVDNPEALETRQVIRQVIRLVPVNMVRNSLPRLRARTIRAALFVGQGRSGVATAA